MRYKIIIALRCSSWANAKLPKLDFEEANLPRILPTLAEKKNILLLHELAQTYVQLGPT